MVTRFGFTLKVAKFVRKLQRNLLCDVCGNVADGFHFGALSCSACSAFFRRSISEHKRYICLTRDCDVTKPMFLESRKHGIVCRYCRFQKCISVGMRPEEVQSKRGQKTKPAMDITKISEFPSTSERSPEKIRQLGQERIAKLVRSIKVPKLKGPNVHTEGGVQQRERSSTGIEESILSTVHQIRKRMDKLRRKKYDGHNFKKLNLTELHKFFLHEKSMFDELVLSNSVVKRGLEQCQPGSWDAQDVLLSWLVLEIALSTLTYGGIQTNRLYTPGKRFIELHVDGLADFHRVEHPQEARTLARLALPIGRFFLESLCRSLQMEHLTEKEIDTIFAMLLFNLRSGVGQQNQLKHQIFSELFAPPVALQPFCANPTSTSRSTTAELSLETSTLSTAYASMHRFQPYQHHQIALRLGGIILIQGSLLQLVEMLREHYNALTISR